MEQKQQQKPQRNSNDPKQPKFNMGWLYALILGGLLYMLFTESGSQMTNSALGAAVKQEATYTKFKEYVDSG